MFTQAKLTTTKTSNELLIEFLEKRGLKQKAESLRNDATSLDLGHNQIEAEGAKVLADALKTNSSIASLDIGWNQIGDEGIRVFADALKINNSITSLDIGYSKIGDEGARLLADALKTNTALTRLYLEYNQIGDAGAIGLADALKINSSITYLDIYGNQIGNAGARGLANALKTNNSITYLNLRGNEIGAAGARVLADALETNTSITSLDLGSNNIGIVEDKKTKEKINYNKELVKKLPLLLNLLSKYFKNNTDEKIEFKVLTANKFYKVVNKQLLKENLQKQGINDVESELKKVDDLIKRKPFTIADVCKDIQPDKVAPGELHISNLPTEIMDNILAYVGDTPWGWEVVAIGNTVEPAG